jgi:hypothetical protein
MSFDDGDCGCTCDRSYQLRRFGQATGGKEEKEEMIEKKSLDKAKEELVEASYYWEMYNSNVC